MKNFIEFTDLDSGRELFVKKDNISWIDHDECTAYCIIHVWPNKELRVAETLNYILEQLGEISYIVDKLGGTSK